MMKRRLRRVHTAAGMRYLAPDRAQIGQRSHADGTVRDQDGFRFDFAVFSPALFKLGG